MTELEKLAALPGLIPDDQGLVLAEYAGKVSHDRSIVEVGSYRGKSTCYLAHGAGNDGTLVWAIDPWDSDGNVNGRHHFAEPATKQAFDAAVALMGYESRIVAVREFSIIAAKQWGRDSRCREIGMLYLDGDHSEDAVRGDFKAWLPYLATDATVIFDDLDTPRNPGVRVVVDEILKSRAAKGFSQIGRLGIFTL